jgi:glycosyltransferase involved in cell wall biosynthesis
MRVSLVHDWLNGMRGGEQVLQAIASIFPRAAIYTLFCDSEKISGSLKKHEIMTSFIQNLPKRKEHYRYYLPLFPRAIEKFRFADTDVLISSSHCVAKGAVASASTLHICYCHSPMRYVWDRFDDYFPKRKLNPVKYMLISKLASRLRNWDRESARRVDLFIANSNFVRQRIKDYYGRPAKVIYPPVDVDYYTPGSTDEGEYYLVAGALVPYKKVDLVIEAFRGLDRKLVVIGDGPDFSRLVNTAPANVSFTGWVDRETLRDYCRGCKALIFPGVEDFGIVPVEVQACGKPVIAFGEGGALETVRGSFVDEFHASDNLQSGILLRSQTTEAVRKAVEVIESREFDPLSIRKNVLRFSGKRFFDELNGFLMEIIGYFRREGKFQLEERFID